MLHIETPRQFRSFARLIIFSAIAVILLIGLFESTPLYASSTANLLALTTAQEWASQRITKDVLLMKGTMDDRTQATNELQNELPYWEQNQETLKASFLPSDIDVLFSSGNIDFIDIDTAAKQILGHPAIPADAEVQIVSNHERSFFLTETQIVSALQARQMTETHWLFGIEAFLGSLLLVLGVCFLFVVERLLQRYLHSHPEAATTPIETLPGATTSTQTPQKDELKKENT